MNSLKLDVMIATYGLDGIARVAQMNLPRVDGVRFLVSWQLGGANPSQLPQALIRPDIKVMTSDSRGLSRNRNLLLQAAEGDYCLIADDDLKYRADQLHAVIEALDSNPRADVAVFKYDTATKYYPSQPMDISRRTASGHNISSVEIAMRRNSVKGLWFNENFGVGAFLSSGEENIFIEDCRRAGLRLHYFPITICAHKGLTTGERKMSVGTAMAQGAYIRYAYGFMGFPRAILAAWRHWRSGQVPLARGMRDYIKGFFSTKALKPTHVNLSQEQKKL